MILLENKILLWEQLWCGPLMISQSTMLFRWGTNTKLACPICMEDSKTFTLKFNGKTSWFDSCNRFLPYNHPFWWNKKAFVKDVVEIRGPSIQFTSEQV